MKKRHAWIWMVLILLTLLVFLLGEMWKAGLSRAGVIMIIAAVKFSLVAWWYMELRGTSRIWALGLFALLGAILVLPILLG